MARPIKNTADYFPHDTNKRDDPKMKAVRRKFGFEGYAVYFMLQEYLGQCEFFQFKKDTLTIEIIAGDFGIDTNKLTEIIDYFCVLNLIQCDAKTLNVTCSCLENSLGGLLSKRKRERSIVIDADNTQSKVKGEKIKSIEKKSTENITLFEIPLTLPFNSQQFQTAWGEWQNFRKEIKKRLTDASAKKQLALLGSFSEVDAIGMINQSIQNGWTGLFELKNNNGTGNGKNQGIEKYSGATAHNADGADYSEPL